MKIFSASSNLRRTMMFIAGAFVLVTIGVIAVAAIARRYASEGARQTETLTAQFLPGLVTLARLQESTLKLNGIALQFTLAKDEESTKAQHAAFQAQTEKIAQFVALLKAADASPDTQQRIGGFVAAVQAVRPSVERLQAELKAGEFEKAMATLDNDVASGQQRVEVELRALSEHFFQLSQGAGAATRTSLEQSSRFSTIASAVLVGLTLVALAATLVGGRSISLRLVKLASTLKEGAMQVTSAAGQVSSSSQSLASGANQQAASLQETSASLEEMAGMTNRNAENATQANDLTRQARTAADAGASDMQAMTSAMSEIKTSSDDIAKIIKTIDEIAFQTNILALNAAVEAARAGGAGLGFAVVAEEVRALAQRSAQAARETADKIEGAITKTGLGVQISSKVEQRLAEIVEKVRKVDQLVGEVSAASREQSQGVKQISSAVAQMDRIVQDNASSAEESASSAEELNAQSLSLQDAIGELLELAGGAAASATGSVVASEHNPGMVMSQPARNGMTRPVIVRANDINGHGAHRSRSETSAAVTGPRNGSAGRVDPFGSS